jgi:uncharacterized membrane protein YphA (DoxX/SURF4 family)
MHTLVLIDEWASKHHPKWIDIFRVALGVVLLAKGLSYVNHSYLIGTLVADSSFGFVSIMIASYVVLAQIGAGIMLILGLKTRTASLFTLPILIVAVFFVNLPQGFHVLNYELYISITALFLTIFFLIFGSGEYSLDHHLATHEDH